MKRESRVIGVVAKVAAILLAAMLAAAPASAQQITGTLGSPDATTTIEGKQLPPPPSKFGGVIKESAKDSKSWWPPRVVPPKGAPNVLLIMTDDQGYGVSGTFGGVIPTPAMDRIAKAGLRYTQFHSTALCSPTRAALITGRNHHSVGLRRDRRIVHGLPRLRLDHRPRERHHRRDPEGERLLPRRGSARTTTRPAFNTARPGRSTNGRAGWAFEYFYGFMGGETDQWTPYLFRDHTQIFPWVGKPGYNLTTDMADEAIKYMSGLNAAAPDQPFFVYYVPGGTHSPHQPTPEWIEKFKGKFDMGWNKLREQIFANQKRLGVIPANTQLTPWPDDLPKWDTLSLEQKKLFARQAEVFAAYAAYTDHEIGRVIQAVEDMGKLDNTLIIYISGDNGTSAEGTLEGTSEPVDRLQRHPDSPRGRADEVSTKPGARPRRTPHMAVAWSWAFDTPFKWTKQVASHFGGTRQGMGISWPGRIKDAGGIRTQFHHMIDIVPTILEAAGIPAPTMVDGIAQKPIEGVSMAYTFDKANARAPSKRKTQYFEMVGNRGIYHDGWYACTTPPAPPWLLGTGKLPACERLQVGALQPHRGLLAVQRPCGEDARQAEGDAGAVPDGGGEIPRTSRWTTRSSRGCSTPRPSAIAGRTVFTYIG